MNIAEQQVHQEQQERIRQWKLKLLTAIDFEEMVAVVGAIEQEEAKRTCPKTAYKTPQQTEA